MHSEREINEDEPESAVVDLEQVTAAVDLLPTVESTSAPAGCKPFACFVLQLGVRQPAL